MGGGRATLPSAGHVQLLTNLLMLILERKALGWGRGRWRLGGSLWGPPDDIEGSALIVTTGQKNLQPHPVPSG